MSERFGTLVETLLQRADEDPSRLLYQFLGERGEESDRLTRGELDRRARAVAAALQEQGAAGERALLLHPPGLDFIAAFFGCLYAGAIAVPAYPPRGDRGLGRLRAIAEDARPRLVLTTARWLPRVAGWCARVASLATARVLATDHCDAGAAAAWLPPRIDSGSVAFLQYTSGSTADPKGVMVSHANLLHNEEAIRQAFGQSERSVVVSWLPLYHDMGLIGGVLQPLYAGSRCVLMSPLAFLQRPARWLQAISRHRGTTSGGPDFAYALAARRVSAEERSELDLACWEVAFNGAEPVRAATIERFASVFAPCGFRRRAFLPCYGLAEATLFVSGGAAGSGPAVAALPASAAGGGASGVAAAPGRQAVGCGGGWLGQEVAIADPGTATHKAAGEVGEIWLAGPSVAGGYWNRPAETARDFGARLADRPHAGPYLRTGDLGLLHEGQLFVTGRAKDLVILHGRNHYPQDLEATAESAHPALRAGGAAAFAVEVAGEERLVVCCEVDRRAALPEAAAAVRRAVAEEHEAAVHEIQLLPPGGIPRTSSGKIRRQACRLAYLESTLEVWERSIESALPPAPAEQPATGPGAPARAAFRAALLRLPAEARLSALLSHLQREAVAAARLPAARALDPERSLAGLGLDSLAAAELQLRLDETLQSAPSLAELLEAPSLAALAHRLLAHLDQAPIQADTDRMAPPVAGQPCTEFPLSHGQGALWFLHRLDPASAAYHIAGAARVRRRLDLAALRRAWEGLVARHPALRTTFHDADGEPRQRIGDRTGAGIEETDAAGWSAARLEEALSRDVQRPFDLAAGPLVRVAIYRHAEGEATVLLAVHHIVADFGSLRVLARELAALYAAEHGRAMPSSAPPLTYADYVRWQRAMLAGPRGERLWSYWRDRLTGPLPALELPADRPRPPAQGFRGAAADLLVPAATTTALRGLAATHGVTPFMVLLAAYQALLARYSGQTDILVGSPTAGRTAPGLENLVGYFVNPLVMRADLAGDPPFATHLRRVGEMALAAFEHQDFPFPLLAERLQPERDASRSPLFQVSFTWQPGDEPLTPFALRRAGVRVELGELPLDSVRLPETTSRFDLSLFLGALGGDLAGYLQYSAELFDAATARRMARHLECLLAGVAARPGAPLSELPLLTPAEFQQHLAGGHGERTAFPLDRCLHQLFAEQAARTPAAVAVECGERRWTYGELARRSGRLAARLRSLGLGPESAVALCCERSPEMVMAMLGILAAGACFVPLDPEYPVARLGYMVRDARAALLLTHGRLASSLAGEIAAGEIPVIDLDGEPPAGGGFHAAPATYPEGLLCILYTSGSTGRPKGVMVPHRGIVNRVLWAQRAYPVSAADRVLQIASISFDFALWECFAPLLAGGCLVLAAPGGQRDAAYIARTLAERRITIVHFVPAVLREVLGEPELAGCDALRLVLSGGEALPPELAVRALSHLPAALLNQYGPTEASIDVTWWRCGPADRARRTVPVGQPLDNCTAHVVDAGMRLQPPGVTGELVVGGEAVTRGYLGRPELTAERFVPDPFSGEPGARLYCTGDLARASAGGVLEVLGRLDHQVKVRGIRIELGEIESVLAEHPAVEQAAVAACGGGARTAGEARLVAWYVPAGAGAAAEELRRHLAARLPSALLPAVFVQLPALPLGPTGKVDRQALPVPDAGPEAMPERPFTPTEELLAGIWADLLERPAIGLTDDFFHLGGHSLLATRLLARVERTLGIALPVRSLFAEPTLAGLARAIELAAAAGAVPPAAIPRAPRDLPLPLSFAQQDLWLFDQIVPGNAAYNVPLALRLDGPLEEAALERVLDRLLARHEALRTVFTLSGGEPAQVVSPPAPLALRRLDLAGLEPAGRRRAAAERALREESRRPFALDRGPLVRGLLLRLAAGEHLLLLVLHHIVVDGWSLQLLLRELQALGAGLAAGSDGTASPTLPELPIQYGDYAAWQRHWLQGEALAGQLAYWRRQLAGAPRELALPADRRRPAVRGFRGARRSLALGGTLDADLPAATRREAVTLFMLLLAIWQTLLARYSGQDDVTVGSPVADRQRPELERLIGCFVNTLVFRAQLAPGSTLRSLLAKVRETALAAYEHQQAPFARVVDELRAERGLGATPLFQTAFVLRQEPMASFDLLGAEALPFTIDNGTAKFDLTLYAGTDGDGWEATLEYSTELFDAPTAGRCMEHYRNLLLAALGEPDRCLAALPLLAGAERRQVVAAQRRRLAAPPPAACLHEIFARRAAAAPAAPALLCEGRVMSYGELDHLADRLALRLRARGVGPEVRVGICLERSPELVVAMLAVLKAGGAYLPLDPSHPRDRLARVLADSRAPVAVAATTAAAWLAEQGVAAVHLDSAIDAGPWPAAGAAPAAGASAAPDPANLAYVIYTSGSTGVPKGVGVTHANALRLFTACRDELGLGAADTWSFFHSCAFDFSVWEIWGALLHGGKLVVVPYWTSRSPEAFHHLLCQERVTVLSQTPSAFRQLSRVDAATGGELALRLVVFGGEALDFEDLRGWMARHGESVRMVNMYGITETTVHVTSRPVGPADLGRGRSLIGGPLADLDLMVLDRELEPVPPGVAGELLVGGDGLARGYLGRPDLTAERFIPDPWSPRPGARLYRSGDLARRLPDGDLEYLGRLDDQVKIRGFRIEPGEIEAHLRACPGVAEAAVVLRRGAGAELELVGYVSGEAGLTPSGIKSTLAAALPAHMVPAAVVVLDRFPLTVNGKLDRTALPSPPRSGGGRSPGSGARTAPRNPVEARLATIWEEHLGCRDIGVEDTFFDLGGDSIKAIRLIQRLNAELGASLETRDLFLHQTIAALAPLAASRAPGGGIEAERAAGEERIARFQREILADPAQAALLPAGREDFYPLSTVEKGMIYHSLLLAEEPVYHDQYTFFLELDDPARFFTAFALALGRHPVLRSSYRLYGFSEPLKVVHRTVPPSWSLEDLSGLPRPRQIARLRAYLRADLDERFTFDGELLWRLRLFRLEGAVHLAVWTTHHAINDGWSNVSLWVEVNALAGSAERGPLAPLRSSYRDYLAVTLGRESQPAAVAFWRRRLAGHSRNRLPFHSTPEPAAGAMRIAARALPRDLLAALRETARSHQVSLQALCLAAHVYLLHATSGEAEVLTGVVSHDRPSLPDGDRILGCFLNSVPLRIAVRPGERRAALVTRVDRALNEAKAHELPLSTLAAACDAPAGGANPFFDTLFNFTNFHVMAGAERTIFPSPERARALAERWPLEHPNEMTNTLLDLEVSTTLDELGVRIKYGERCFAPAQVERLLAMYQRLLELWSVDLSPCLDTEDLLAPPERRRLLHELNATAHPYSAACTLHELVERQVRARPAATAVVAGGRRLSYAELDACASRLARQIQHRGVVPGDQVALIAERSCELAVGALAILKAGAAYVPVEPDYPAARRGYILRNSAVACVLADGAAGQGGAGAELPHVGLAGAAEPPVQPARRGPLAPLEPRAVAYTIYTSGSTGQPKGVVVEHHAAVNLIEWVNREHRIGPGARVLALSSICFDLSVYDLFGALIAGATVVMPGRDDLRDAARLRRLLDAERITFWSSVPSTMGHLVKHLDQDAPGYCNDVLEVVFLSGDWIPLPLPGQVRRFFPRARVISLGGATEATVWSNHYPIGEVAASWVSIPYGKPIANSSFYVLDPGLRAVPAGVVGGLYIGGVGVATAYANDPVRTAAAFLPDRFAAAPGSRMYRTGDLGRMMADGNLEFLGRADHQVKIRGFRVELGEIESQLARHPAVRAAVVMARADRTGEKFLCAYVVSPTPPAAAELRNFLGRSLPEYMLPSSFVVLPELPLTANGKVDRRSLPEPDAANLSTTARHEPPQTPAEAELAAMWEEILGVVGVGVGQDFFELGGHSLSAVQLVARIRGRFGVELPLRRFWEAPTVSGVARLLGELTAPAAAAAAGAAPDGQAAPLTEWPLSPAQERVWFLQQLDPGGAAFHLGGAVRLSGRLSVPAFRAAVSEVMRRHETLRARFDERLGRPVQSAAPPRPCRLPLVDLGGLAPRRRERELARLAEEQTARPFDLRRGPLLRAGLVRLAPREHAAWLVLHHIAGDGWSLGLVSREVAELCAAFAAGAPSPLPAPPLRYADHVEWQRRQLAGGRLEEQLAYWRRQLSGPLPELALPGHRRRPSRPRFRGAAEPVLVPRRVVTALSKLAREEGATLFMALLAGFKALLAGHSGLDELVVGTSVANRDRPEVEGLIGLFVNNLALRTDLAGNPTFRELLRRVREVVLGALAHQDVPFETVLAELRPERRGSYSSLFQAMLVLQNFPAGARELAGLVLTPLELQHRTANFDLQLMLAETADGLAGSLVYDRDLFEAPAMAELAAGLRSLLAAAAADPARRLLDLAGAAPAPLHDLVIGFNEDLAAS